MVPEDLPVIAFADTQTLREWLVVHGATSQGVWVRLAKGASARSSVTFLELLDAGLCFGWSESTRRRGDSESYLQRFAPRRKRGTASSRNRTRAAELIEVGLMTPRGLAMLDL